MTKHTLMLCWYAYTGTIDWLLVRVDLRAATAATASSWVVRCRPNIQFLAKGMILRKISNVLFIKKHRVLIGTVHQINTSEQWFVIPMAHKILIFPRTLHTINSDCDVKSRSLGPTPCLWSWDSVSPALKISFIRQIEPSQQRGSFSIRQHFPNNYIDSWTRALSSNDSSNNPKFRSSSWIKYWE